MQRDPYRRRNTGRGRRWAIEATDFDTDLAPAVTPPRATPLDLTSSVTALSKETPST